MPLPYKLGSNGQEITDWGLWFQRAYKSYAPKVDGYYGNDEVTAVNELQRRLGLPVTGIFDQATADAAGYKIRPSVKPIMFTVEGHSSDMLIGPVAATAEQLESEGRCHHQPIGYNAGALPFDNASGVNELARLVGSNVMDNGVPFPAGTPWSLAGFSQGGIVVSYFYFDHLAPGKDLNWRLKDLRGVLAYGNPCRQTDSVAPWMPSTKKGTHGLDPYRRFGLPSYPIKPDNWIDVYREGDIFADNGDDRESGYKASIYEAVMSDFTSNPYSLAAELVELFKDGVSDIGALFNDILGIIMAIISGASFLADNPNPHYSPFDIGGGIDWMRSRLA